MDRYSHADRTALTGAARRILSRCDCHGKSAIQEIGGPGIPAGCAMGMSPDTRRVRLDDGTTYCAFEPGAGIEVSPTGQASYYRAPPEIQPWDGAGPPEACPRAAVCIPDTARGDSEPAGGGLEGIPPEVPLPAAFRVCRLDGDRPASVPFAVPSDDPDDAGARTVWKEAGQVPVRRKALPRHLFEECLPSYPDAMGFAIKEYEDAMCLERLEGLGAVDDVYTCRQDSTLGGLVRFVAGLNAARPRALRLDTILVNYDMCLALFWNDRRTASWAPGYPFYDGRLLYRNMSALVGIAFLHHPDVPHDGAYALSSAQGPVFVHGPSSIRCTAESIVMRRQCGVVEPPEGAPGCPWGVRFGVDMGYEIAETEFRHGG